MNLRKIIMISIMIVATGFLFSIRNWQEYTNSANIYEITKFEDKYYLATEGGLEIFNPQNSTFEDKYTVVDGLKDHQITSVSAFESSDKVLFGSFVGGAYSLKEGILGFNINPDLGLLDLTVNDIQVKDSLFFCATKKGLSIFTEGNDFPIIIDNIDTSNGLSSNNVKKIVFWNEKIILMLDNKINFKNYENISDTQPWNEKEFSADVLNDIEVINDKLFLASNSGIFSTEDLSIWDNYIKSDGLVSDSVYAIEKYDEDEIIFSYGFWNENYNDFEFTYPNTIDIMNLETEDISHFNENIETQKIKDISTIDGKLIFSTWGDGFYSYDYNEMYNFKPNCIGTNSIKDIIIDENNDIYVCSGYIGAGSIPKGTKGVSRFKDGVWTTFRKKDGNLVDDNIYAMAVDQYNRKWFGGITGSSVSILDDSEETDNWEYLNESDGLLHDYVSTITKAPNNTMLVSSYDAGINVVQNSEDYNFSVLDDFNFEPYVFDDYNGNISDPIEIKTDDFGVYITTNLSGFLWFDGFDYDNISWNADNIPGLEDGLVSSVQTNIDEYGNHEIWVAGDEGLFSYIGNRWYRYGISVKKKVLDGNSWKDSEYYSVDETRIYSSNSTSPTAVYLDPFERVWIGTADNGITIFDKRQNAFSNFDMENTGLVSNSITSFDYDPETGFLYIGTPNGLNSVEIGKKTSSSDATRNVVAFPNPFYPEKLDNGKMYIRNNEDNSDFSSDVTECRIFDINGQLIVELEKSSYGDFEWNGKNGDGKKCSSGVYFYVLDSGGEVFRGKIALIR